MTAQIKELKTNRTRSKEGMLEYLKELQKKVEADQIENLVLVYGDSDSLINSMVIGEVSFVEAIGMLATAQTALQMSHFYGDADGE